MVSEAEVEVRSPQEGCSVLDDRQEKPAPVTFPVIRNNRRIRVLLEIMGGMWVVDRTAVEVTVVEAMAVEGIAVESINQLMVGISKVVEIQRSTP